MRTPLGPSFVSSLVFYGTLALFAGVEPADADPAQPGCDEKAKGSVAGCEVKSGSGGAAAAPAAAGDKVYVLGIEGMMCPTNCAPTVKESIESIDGVKSADVDFENKQAVVHTNADAELTTKKVDESFANKGYFVSSLEVKAAE